MEYKLRRLANMLMESETYDFGYDSYRDGQLEYAITKAQVEVCKKIAEYIIEILDEKEEVVL